MSFVKTQDIKIKMKQSAVLNTAFVTSPENIIFAVMENDHLDSRVMLRETEFSFRIPPVVQSYT